MLEKLIGLQRMTAHNLENISGATPTSGEQEEAEGQPGVNSQAQPTSSQDNGTPSPSYWQRFVNVEREHFGWLRSHPFVIVIALALAIAVVISEQWLIKAWGWMTSQAYLYWPTLISHPVAVIGVLVILLYLIFGLKWLQYIAVSISSPTSASCLRLPTAATQE